MFYLKGYKNIKFFVFTFLILLFLFYLGVFSQNNFLIYFCNYSFLILIIYFTKTFGKYYGIVLSFVITSTFSPWLLLKFKLQGFSYLNLEQLFFLLFYFTGAYYFGKYHTVNYFFEKNIIVKEKIKTLLQQNLNWDEIKIIIQDNIKKNFNIKDFIIQNFEDDDFSFLNFNSFFLKALKQLFAEGNKGINIVLAQENQENIFVYILPVNIEVNIWGCLIATKNVPFAKEELNQIKEICLDLELLFLNLKFTEEKEKTLNVFKELLNKFPWGVVLIKNEKVTLINPQSEKIFHIKKEFSENKNYLEVLPPGLGKFLNDLKIKANEFQKVVYDEYKGDDVIMSLGIICCFINKDEIVFFFRNIDVKELLYSLEEKEKLRFEFIAMVSHELKTPLTSVYGFMLYFLGILEEKEKIKLPELEEFGKLSMEELNRFEFLSKNILYANSQQIMLAGESEKLNLKELILNICKLQEMVFLKIKFILNYETNITEVCLKKNALKQILYNLINNSAKYAGEDEINIQVSNFENSLIIQIIDTGQGIPQENQNKLFNKFYRANTREGGAGLGLFVTKKLVENMQGTINYFPNTPKGSSFEVRLPIKVE